MWQRRIGCILDHATCFSKSAGCVSMFCPTKLLNMSSNHHPLPCIWQGKAWQPSQPSFPEETGPEHPSGARAPHKGLVRPPFGPPASAAPSSTVTGAENPFKGSLLAICQWASTAQTAHLWSRQLGLRGGPHCCC